MTDLSQMSTDDLMAVYNRQKAAPQAAPAGPDLSSMSTEDLLAMRAHQQAAPQSSGLWQDVKDVANNARGAVTDAVSGLGGIAGTVLDLPQRGMYYVARGAYNALHPNDQMTESYDQASAGYHPAIPRIGDVSEGLNKAQQAIGNQVGVDLSPYTPKTELGKVGRDVGTAVLGPGAPLINAAAGLGSYIGGHANDLIPEQYREYTEPVFRVLGSVLGGGAASARQVARESAEQVAPGMIRQRAQGITPEQFDEAARFQEQSPIPMTTAEALGKVQGDGSPIAQLGGDVLASQHGHNAMFTPVLADRPTAVQNAVANFLDTIGPRNAGTNPVSTQLQNAAEATGRQLRQDRSNATSPSYQAAKHDVIDPSVTMDLVTSLQAKRGEFDQKSPVYKELTGYIDRLLPLDRSGSGEPLTDVGVLDNIYKEIRDKINALPTAKNAVTEQTKGVLGPINTDLGNVLSQASQNIAQGRAIHQQMSPEIERFQTSPVGRMVDANNSNPEGAYNQFRQVLNDPKSTPKQIEEVARTLNAQDPNAFRDALRLHLDEQMQKSLDRKTNIGRAFHDNVVGSNQQDMPKLQTALEQTQGWLPSPSGTSPATVAAQPLFDALESTNRIPGTGSPTATRGTTLEEAASNGMDIPDVSHIPAMAVHIASGGIPGVGTLSQWALKSLSAITGMEQVGRSLVQGRNLSKIGAILGSPDGVREVQRILAMPEGAPKTQAAAQLMFLAAKGAGQGDQSTSSQ